MRIKSRSNVMKSRLILVMVLFLGLPPISQADEIHWLELSGQPESLRVQYLSQKRQFEIQWPSNFHAKLVVVNPKAFPVSKEACAEAREILIDKAALGSTRRSKEVAHRLVRRDSYNELGVKLVIPGLTKADGDLWDQLAQIASTKGLTFEREMIKNPVDISVQTTGLAFTPTALSQYLGADETEREIAQKLSAQPQSLGVNGIIEFRTRFQDLLCDLVNGRVEGKISTAGRLPDIEERKSVISWSQVQAISRKLGQGRKLFEEIEGSKYGERMRESEQKGIISGALIEGYGCSFYQGSFY
jgi:hypothetical protein